MKFAFFAPVILKNIFFLGWAVQLGSRRARSDIRLLFLRLHSNSNSRRFLCGKDWRKVAIWRRSYGDGCPLTPDPCCRQLGRYSFCCCQNSRRTRRGILLPPFANKIRLGFGILISLPNTLPEDLLYWQGSQYGSRCCYWSTVAI